MSYSIAKQVNSTIFRAYDIRGLVHDDLTDDVVFTIARALGQTICAAVHAGKVPPSALTCVLGYDGRHSSPGFAKAATAGLLMEGIDVIDLGVVPSPVTYFAAHHLGQRSALMITGSHNPKQYNGLKMMIGAQTIFGDAVAALYDTILLLKPESDQKIGKVERYDIVPEYVEKITTLVQEKRGGLLYFSVVIDAGNGVAGPVDTRLFSALGCKVHSLYCDIDGDFPNHHPDPSKAKNLVDLQAAVAQQQADIGLAFDGDGDRMGVVTNQGTIIWPDRQMMALAQTVLQQQPGAVIVFDVKCSRHLAAEIKRMGGRPHLSQTGHALIKHAMIEQKAPLAGELSGHIFFGDPWYGVDDALYAGVELLTILTQAAQDYTDAEQFFAQFPQGVATPEIQMPVAEADKFNLVEQLKQRIDLVDAEAILLDGVRLEWDYGWGLVRASNTTPCLTLRFEGDSAESLARVKQDFKTWFTQVSPKLGTDF